MPKHVPGTQGYEEGAERFIAATEALDFQTVCGDYLPFLPKQPARVLDLGAGAGQNSAALAAAGHQVTAVEPVRSFRVYGQDSQPSAKILWVDDALPALSRLSGPFDFILAEAVWHHLDAAGQRAALGRATALLAPRGALALSLRNGPAGMGRFVHPTDATLTIRDARALGLQCVLDRRNLPSLLPGKAQVSWCRLAFKKSH